MIVVHHLNHSRSLRVLWLLEELGLDYRIEHYQRDPQTLLAPPTLKAVHPLGKSPVVRDGDTVLAESGALITSLLERHGNGRLIPPIGTPERLRYTYWLHYAEGSLMPYLVMTLMFSKIPGRVPFVIRPVAKGIVAGVKKGFLAPNLKAHLDFIEQELARSTWFAGEALTAADIQMSFPMEVAMVRADNAADYPRIRAFVERVHAMPGYQRALAKGGPLEVLR